MVGSVGTSKKMFEAMIEVGFPISFVFSIDEAFFENISGYQPIHKFVEKHGIPSRKLGK